MLAARCDLLAEVKKVSLMPHLIKMRHRTPTRDQEGTQMKSHGLECISDEEFYELAA